MFIDFGCTIPSMLQLLEPFMWLSAVGFLFCVTIHAAALLGIQIISARNLIFLFAGVFIVYVPAILVTNWMTRDFKRKEWLKAALRGCPKWMRTAVNVFGGYAVLSFLAVMIAGRGQAGIDDSRVQSGMFSAYGMAFYWTSFALLFSAFHVKDSDAGRRCLNGHRVSPSAKFCEECGAPVIAGTSAKSR
jgi:hypothetical protein